MEISKKQRNILLIILGILIILLILFFMFWGKTKEYEVTFDTDGGSTINSITVRKNGRVSQPEDPIKEGYIFDGWYYEDELFDFQTKITSDIILKARWIKEEERKVHLDLEELSLNPGSTHTFDVENNTKQKLKWTSSDSSIVSVDENGKITALKIGVVTITVMTEDGKYQDTCEVTVTDDLVSVMSVSIRGASEVTVGRTIQLSANIQPEDASNKVVVWTSSDEKIATVDEFGRVHGIKAGKVTITVTTEDGNKTAKKNITVKADMSPSKNQGSSSESESNPESKPASKPTPAPEKKIPVQGVKIDGGSSVYVSETLQLTAIIDPKNATNQDVRWESSDNKIATVDQNGKVVGVQDGEVTITVTTKDGNYSDKKTITVTTLYEIVFNKKYNNYKVPVGYHLTVYKNKKAWTGFTSIVYRGSTKKFSDFFAAMDEIDEKVKTASIKIEDVVIDKVTVSYQ